jgi:hypothetical protein
MSAALRELAGDGGGIWCQLGLVARDEGATAVHEVNADGELMVSVALHDQGRVVWANLANNAADWYIPDEGDEVLVHFPDGEIEGDAVLVGVVSTGSVPADVAPGRKLIAAAEVYIEAGSPPLSRQVEPTYKADTHDALLQPVLATIASAAAGVGGGVTAAINAAVSAYNAALATAKTGSKLS